MAHKGPERDPSRKEATPLELSSNRRERGGLFGGGPAGRGQPAIDRYLKPRRVIRSRSSTLRPSRTIGVRMRPTILPQSSSRYWAHLVTSTTASQSSNA